MYVYWDEMKLVESDVEFGQSPNILSNTDGEGS